MSIQVFTVLTEFQFEAGAALATSDKLTTAVDGISQAADRSLQSVKAMGFGIISSFLSGPGGGILGVLGAALYSFDSFQQKQIQLANILTQGGTSFAEGLIIADKVMEDINKKAIKFGLPTEDLINVTKLIAPQLMNKGLAGENLSAATDLSRGFLKSSPILGINPQDAFGQLQRAIEGDASGGDTMFNRLAGETNAMKQFVGNAKAFNALNPAMRVAKLNAAFGQFANNAQAVDMRLNSLTGQMQVLKNQLTGAFSVMRPLGEAVSNLVLPVLRELNEYIKTNLSVVMANLARVFKALAPDARNLAMNLMAMKDLKENVTDAGSVLTFAGALVGIQQGMAYLGIQIPVVTSLLGFFAGKINALSAPLAGSGAISVTTGGVFGFLDKLVILISRILAPLAALVLVFDMFSRTVAAAKINDAKEIAALAPAISENTARFAAMWGVFQEGQNNIANFLAPLLQMAMWVELLTDILSYASEKLGLFMAVFQGFVFEIMELANQIKSFMSGNGFNSDAIGAAGQAGIDEMIKTIFGFKDEDDTNTSQKVVNQNVTINQEFKQQQEPDRIAFTVADTLMKLARNPTQATNGGFAQSGTGR